MRCYYEKPKTLLYAFSRPEVTLAHLQNFIDIIGTIYSKNAPKCSIIFDQNDKILCKITIEHSPKKQEGTKTCDLAENYVVKIC